MANGAQLRVTDNLKKEILANFNSLLAMKKNGKNLFFPDIDRIKEIMLDILLLFLLCETVILLSLISGLEKKYEGEILYDGKSLSKMDLDKYRNSDIGIVFQSYNLLPQFTAEENIILSMDISNVKNIDKKEKALELMKQVGLNKSLANRRVLKLSGGEQQRIAIARSLSYNPKIIIADEPTGNLDKETESEILKIFNNLAHQENKCVIIVTHSPNVCDLVDQVYDLKKSK